jgi:hypothetical protein
LFYETINGAWTIALCFMIVFLLHYLYDTWRTIGLRSFLFERPIPEQFAIAILIADSGNLMVRGSTWAWRTIGADVATVSGPIAWGLLLGATIGTAGILCKIRIVTVVRFGHWPWLACLCSVLTFVLFWIATG